MMNRRNFGGPRNGRRSQSGVILVVTMLFLIMLTLIGTAAINMSTSEERMARSMRDYNVAIQAAESALRDAQYDILNTGPWLQPALVTAGVDPSLWLTVCHQLIDKVNDTIAPLADPAKNIHYINSRGVLDCTSANYRNDWANEMHPTLPGFNKVVDQRWIPALVATGIAN